ERAAGQSALLQGLVESGEVYQPIAFTPEDAYRFMKDIPVFEASGVVVRVPDWWRSRRAPRPQVQVTLGSKAPGGFGADALIDFDVRVTLDGEALTEAEIERAASATAGLALIRGKWVELDSVRLREALEHWKKVKAVAGRDGIGFIEGMRLLSGAAAGDGAAAAPHAETAAWSDVVAGPWLQEALDGLRRPDGLRDLPRPRALRAELRPCQEIGVRWLSLLDRLGLGACLADDMGLGKTIQVIALLLWLKERGKSGAVLAGEERSTGGFSAPPASESARPERGLGEGAATEAREARVGGPSLLVVPASLIADWKAEIERFAPSLAVLVADASGMEKAAADVTASALEGADLVITTYGLAHRIGWLRERHWPLVVLDEAQAIKNPGAKQSQAVKALRARSRVALTGTPV